MASVSEQELRDMKLHTEKTVGGSDIQRVVGGWVYWKFTRDKIKIDKGVSVSCAVAGVFVPENVFVRA